MNIDFFGFFFFYKKHQNNRTYWWQKKSDEMLIILREQKATTRKSQSRDSVIITFDNFKRVELKSNAHRIACIWKWRINDGSSIGSECSKRRNMYIIFVCVMCNSKNKSRSTVRRLVIGWNKPFLVLKFQQIMLRTKKTVCIACSSQHELLTLSGRFWSIEIWFDSKHLRYQ